MTQNYESLRIKASRLCPKSGFRNVVGQFENFSVYLSK